MKAIYRDAGLPFPEITPDDVLPEANTAAKRARVQKAVAQAEKILSKNRRF